jgi:MoaA/NifB/PqqE/SkfB family radical SAM enzyme
MAPDRFRTLIFFITSRCNQYCPNCFNRENLNAADDLKTGEIIRVFQALPRFETLLLSGGEPTLREDFADIVDYAAGHNRIKSLSLPTNGFDVHRCIGLLEGLRDHPELQYVHFAVSLDAMGRAHDQLRGRKGAFERACETLRQAIAVAETAPGKIAVSINTVIGIQPLEEVMSLLDFAADRMPQARHSFELARGMGVLVSPPFQETQLKSFHERVIGRKARATHPFTISFAELARERRRYALQREFFFRSAAWPRIPCSAGRTISVLDANGDVRLCEMKKPVGNVRQTDYSMMSILQGPGVRNRINRLLSERCSCTHVCFLYESMLDSPHFMYVDLPISMVSLLACRRGTPKRHSTQ